MKCNQCGKEVIDGQFCPNCGANQDKTVNVVVNVKDNKKKAPSCLVKILIAFICIVIFISIIAVGAGAGDDSPKKEIGESTNSSVVEEMSFGLNETAVFRNLKITATEIKSSYGDTYFPSAEGKIFVGIKFTVENISDEDVTVSSIALFDAYVDGIKCDYSLSANVAFDEGTLDGQISSGKKLIGYYAIEVAENWNEIELQIKSSYWSNTKAIFKFNNESNIS
ncbi:MAG: DUF4352 domain-containing protein [Clostridia bacterium]|nr:DUF4352 domain-containing protein [Clostridia bacterium]